VRQIGIMKAIGARAMQIAMMYLVMVLVYSLLALVIAVPAGIIGARAMSNFIAGTINFDITSLTPPAWILLMQVGVGLALPLIAALIPVVNGVRINTRVAIFSTGTGSESSPPHPNRQVHLPLGLHKFTAIFAPILNRKSQILNRKFLLSIRNTFRRKGRLALTLCTLTLASAMFVAVFSARNSLDQALADSLKVLNYDIQFNLNNRFLDDTLMREALKVPGIISAETWEASNARRIFDVAQNNSTEGRNIGVFALPANTQFFKPEVLEGRWLQDDDIESIVVNTYVVEDDPDFKIDSFINLKIGNRTRAFRVVGIIRSVLQGPGSPRTLIYINQSGFRQILSLGRQSSRLLTVTAQKDGTSQAEIGRDLEERFKRINLLVSSYQTTTERANELRFQFDLITTFLLIMAAMLAVVGALGLTGTMSINVLERTREIGVMRAIGASNGSVRSVIIVEGIVIGLVSWALGALAAYPLSALLNSTVGVALLRIPPPLRFSWYGLFLWLAVVLMVATLASLWPAWRASQLTVREVLAYE
jgi:putative ABC transport system permease protein